MNQKMLNQLNRDIGGQFLKPLSRAESFQRHKTGGSVNFLNFSLAQAHKKILKYDDV